ncbi:DNA glycosylase [Rickenella mellea]|uniref:Adenine DNA glycosylase n=1 Tax=Rickenella mellea TaxID=50990 RepID=A0A4Y7Q2A0_9AGAM|nr:DNA glycosylase [Rickenella mellea]
MPKALKRKLSSDFSDAFELDSDNDDAYDNDDIDVDFTISSPRKSPKKTSKKPRKRTTSPNDPGVQLDTQVLVATSTNPHPPSLHTIPASSLPPLRTALVSWFARVRDLRAMPWRKPYDASLSRDEQAQRAYEVWVSEIMLQQTQVATVIPYYNRWMEKFPTIQALAQSNIETINSLWKGLGYYSRASRLLSSAKLVVSSPQYAGRLPDTVDELMKHVPGVGRYSAGAICSIAYGRCEPALDGNVHRLLSRLLALHSPPKSTQTLALLWAGATDLVKSVDVPGDVNQALIELGSTVCKPKDPLCAECPVGEWCMAYNMVKEEKEKKISKEKNAYEPIDVDAETQDIEDLCTLCAPLPLTGGVTRFPMKVVKKKAREEVDVVCVVEWRGGGGDVWKGKGKGQRWFLLVRRPEKGLLAGLHEFPTSPNIASPTAASPATQNSKAHSKSAGTKSNSPSELARIAQSVVSRALVDPVQGQYDVTSAFFGASSSKASQKSTVGDSGNGVREDGGKVEIVHVKPAGDVVHVFSHIRKTYRVCWVGLRGGGGGGGGDGRPPGLREEFDFGGEAEEERDAEDAEEENERGPRSGKVKSTKGKEAKTKKRKRTNGDEEVDGCEVDVPDESPALRLRWVKMEDVEGANIGTGVLKVWKKVQTLWK